jgi:replicative DNA helicase
MNEQRLPPHSRDAETAILGSILIDENLIFEIVEILPTEAAFYVQRARRIYGAMLRLMQNGSPIDTVTVSHEVARDGGEDELSYLFGLTSEAISTYNAYAYAETVAEHYKRRQIIQAAQVIANLAYDTERGIQAVTQESQTAAINALDDNRGETAQSGGEILEGVIAQAEAARLGKFAPTLSLPWHGTKRIRAVYGAMVALGARPAMGKTSFLLQWIRHTAEHGYRVLFFSLEMTKNEVVGRMVMQATGIDEKRILGMEGYEPLTDAELTAVYTQHQKIAKLPIMVDDSSSLHVDVIQARCRAEKMRHGGNVAVFVDYLQYVDGGGRNANRYEIVTDVSRKLKQIAKEVGWVIVAAQLSRAVESRADKRPILSDLRESGQIEQDANLALALYRDEYYYPDTTERPNIAELIVLKNRAGTTGTIDLFWKANAVSFADLAKEVNI